MEGVSAAVGFRFNPTDQELVGYYLLHKVTAAAAAPPYDVPESNLFGELEPWEIWNDPKLKVHRDIAADGLYLFTKLKKVSPKRFDRKVGSGTWSEGEPWKPIYEHHDGDDDEQEEEEVSGEKVEIGRKRKFRYENKGSEQHGAWYLEEYSSLAVKYDNDEYVICRLRKNDRSSSHSATGSKKRKSTCDQIKAINVIDHEKENPTKKRAIRRKAINNNIIDHNPEAQGQSCSTSAITTCPNYDHPDHQPSVVDILDDEDQQFADWIDATISFEDPPDCSFVYNADEALEPLPATTYSSADCSFGYNSLLMDCPPLLDNNIDQVFESLPINYNINDNNNQVVFDAQVPHYFPPSTASGAAGLMMRGFDYNVDQALESLDSMPINNQNVQERHI